MSRTDQNAKALLLSAGFGTRLRPWTDGLPKCLMPIGSKPILGWWLDKLLASGIAEIIVNTHYKSELVEKYISTHPAREKIVIAHEEVLLGTAGTLKKHQDFFAGSPAMMIHGDNFSSLDINAFIGAFVNRPTNCHLTMATFTTDTPKSCGILEFDRDGIVQAFHEKVENPPGFNANGAVYLFDDVVMDFVRRLQGDILDFSIQVLPNFVGQINAISAGDYHVDIGTVANWQKANSLVSASGIGSDFYLRKLDLCDSVVTEIEAVVRDSQRAQL